MKLMRDVGSRISLLVLLPTSTSSKKGRHLMLHWGPLRRIESSSRVKQQRGVYSSPLKKKQDFISFVTVNKPSSLMCGCQSLSEKLCVTLFHFRPWRPVCPRCLVRMISGRTRCWLAMTESTSLRIFTVVNITKVFTQTHKLLFVV